MNKNTLITTASLITIAFGAMALWRGVKAATGAAKVEKDAYNARLGTGRAAWNGSGDPAQIASRRAPARQDYVNRSY